MWRHCRWWYTFKICTYLHTYIYLSTYMRGALNHSYIGHSSVHTMLKQPISTTLTYTQAHCWLVTKAAYGNCDYLHYKDNSTTCSLCRPLNDTTPDKNEGITGLGAHSVKFCRKTKITEMTQTKIISNFPKKHESKIKKRKFVVSNISMFWPRREKKNKSGKNMEAPVNFHSPN